MLRSIRAYWEQQPLTVILLLAIFWRLIAVIFAKGFGMHDDHFLVIEPAQAWLDGMNYNNWLPGGGETGGFSAGLNFFYVGIVYYIMSILEFVGVYSPETKMYIIRFLHAAFSLLVVYYGYKISLQYTNRKTAGQIGLILAILWIFPFFSVRTMDEVFCIPMMMVSLWLFHSETYRKRPLLASFLAGILFGMAFSTRYQTILFGGGIGLVLLINGKWKDMLFAIAGTLFSIGIFQGLVDYLIWGYPFAEFLRNFVYNIDNAYNYITNPWYSFILLLLGLIIPPIGFFIFWGFLRYWKKFLMLFLPVFIFLLVHSIFPNKQERFILPIVPFLIMIGLIGWNLFLESSKFWKKNTKLLKGSWVFFWLINILLLSIISTTYSKKSRVESMNYLSKYEPVNHIALEDSNFDKVSMSPRFYMKQWPHEYEWHSKHMPQDMKPETFTDPALAPAFVLFFEERNLEERVNNVKKLMPGLVFEEKIETGFIDKVMYWLNPFNLNQVIYIYRNTDIVPEKK